MSIPNLGDIGQNVGDQIEKIHNSKGLNKDEVVKALEQVNDSLIIIRKEILYAISHLGFDNMPVVQTTVDGIVTKVEDNSGSIATLVQSGKELSQQIENTNVLIGEEIKNVTDLINAQTGDLDDKYTRLINEITSNVSKISQKADEIVLTVESTKKSIADGIAKINEKTGELEGKISSLETSVSTIDQKADSISLTVKNQKTEFNTAIADTQTLIGKTADELDTKIQGQITTITTNVSSIDQKADNISLTVTSVKNDMKNKVNTSDFTGEKIISQINIDTSGIIISGDKVRLKGKINEISSPSGDLKLILSDYTGADGRQHSKLMVETSKINSDLTNEVVFGIVDDPYYAQNRKARIIINGDIVSTDSIWQFNRNKLFFMSGEMSLYDNSIYTKRNMFNSDEYNSYTGVYSMNDRIILNKTVVSGEYFDFTTKK